jgi:hypothetical protein
MTLTVLKTAVAGRIGETSFARFRPSMATLNAERIPSCSFGFGDSFGIGDSFGFGDLGIILRTSSG